MTDASADIELLAPDGARALLSRHGAHLLAWKPAGSAEQLYLSPATERGAGKAIRGGVPVIFPQFAETGPGPRHGFARTATWELVSQEQGESDALAVLRLGDSDATRAIWPHAFELELSVRVWGCNLDIELACENRGSDALSFTTALHTYFAVGDLDAVSVRGLSGLHYRDKVAQTEAVQRNDLLLPGEKGVLDLDRIYLGVQQELSLEEQLADGSQRRIAIRQQGFDDAVVWNPGPERCAKLPDMPADGWRHMLCVEAASVARPVVLGPGESWVGRQSLALC
jgi:glucose-6-phosphate 1-epimerase